jgi:uncharacterized membrane protein HdeD (DUF308 family)
MEEEQMRGSGRTAFVGVLLLITGTLNIIYAIGALSNATVLVGDQRLLFTNLHAFGWVLVVLGVIQLTAGLSLLGGNTYGRVVGIIAASLGALEALAAIGNKNPWWQLGLFALYIYILHGLVVFGRDMKESSAGY